MERIALEQVHSDISSFSDISSSVRDAELTPSDPIRGIVVATLLSLAFWLLSFITWELLA